jgi:hypothetical protein
VSQTIQAQSRLSRVELAFEAWVGTHDGLTILYEISRRATVLKARGFQHYGIKAIFEAVRYDRDIQVGPDIDGYKLNNNHTSFLARRIMERYPDLRGFFETRILRGL